MNIILKLVQVIKNKPELTILIIAGLLVRIIGIHPGYFAHGDELMYGEAVYMLLHKTLGMEPQILGYYPPLVAWIMLILFSFVFIPATFLHQIPNLISNLISSGTIFGPQSPTNFFENSILGHNWINAMYWGRYITAFFGTGIIVLTYFISHKIFYNRLTSFLSALFVTLNYRLVLNSKIGFPDIFNAFFLLIAILAILRLFNKPTFKNYLLAWTTTGLSFLIKYQLYAALAFFIVHLLLSLRLPRLTLKKFVLHFLSKKILIGGVVTLLFVIASHYYHFQNWDRVRGMYEYQALKYGLGVNSLNIYPISYIYHIMLGSFLSLAAVGGMLLGITKKEYRVATIVLASVVIYNCFVYLYYSTGGTYTRNFLAILPLGLIFSAAFINWLWEKFMNNQKTANAKIFAFTALMIIIFLSVKDQITNTLNANQILSNPSARILVERWVNENIPAGSAIGVYLGGFSPPDNKFSIKTFSGIDEVLSFKELAAEGTQYVIVDFYILNNSFVWWMGQPTDIALRFWGKPNDLLSQSFSALATRELLWNHTVQAYLPKWQAPGYNYIVAETNDEIKTNYHPFTKYTFDKDAQGWTGLYYFEQTRNLLYYSDELGYLKILNEDIPSTGKIRRILSRPGSIRWQSPILNSHANYAYKVTGKIKNNNELKKNERNGFLRLDFYSQPPESLESRSIISFVSQRVFGESQWHEVDLEGIAPVEAKYLTVGFQVDQGKIPFYLDEVEIFESDQRIHNLYQNKKYTISDDDLFNPNDGGFL